MSPFPILKTNRLILRRLKPEDKNEIFLLRSNQKVNQFLDREIAVSIEDAQKFIEKIINNELIYWAVTLKEKPNLIGTICLFNFSEESSSAEVGFELLPDYQKKGIISEALTAVLNYAFETMNLQTIDAVVHRNNLKSIKLLEKFNFVSVTKLKENYTQEEIGMSTLLYQLGKEKSVKL